MLGYLNGLGRAQKSSGSTKTKTKGILKKAFKVLPMATAVRVAKKVIAKNKTKPRAASQNTQYRALKNAVAQKKAQTFVKKNKALFLDDTELNETPALEESIVDDQLDQEVENEIEMEDNFNEDQADLGIYFPDELSGSRKDRKKEKKDAKLDKKKAKTEKIRSKAQLKKDKGQAKIDRANKPKGSLKDITSTVLDTVKGGVAVFKDIKSGGSGSGDESLPSQSPAGESFFAKNKTLLIVGGVALLGGAFLLMKNKGKGK